MSPGKPIQRRWWLVLAAGLFLLSAGAGYYFFFLRGNSPSKAIDSLREVVTGKRSRIRVDVTRPEKGMERVSVQPCSVHAYEEQAVRSEVSGFLKTRDVDLNDRVTKGQKLATIAVPELEQQVVRCKALVMQANARVKQMEARIESATADWVAAEANVEWARAKHKSAQAWTKFRKRQLDRFKKLVTMNTVEKKLRDEYEENFEAAQESERAAKAGVSHSEAVKVSAKAKIRQAEADKAEALSEVGVAQSDQKKAETMVGFATLTSEYDGVVTERNAYPGNMVRAFSAGGADQPPLLVIQRTDKFRVVVQVPASDAPYTHKGDQAWVTLDGLEGEVFPGYVSRPANALNPTTRQMLVEIDLENKGGKIKAGMFGRAKIQLEKAPDRLALPVACLHNRKDNKADVYVVRGDKAERVRVETGYTDGRKVAILKGLPENAVVVAQASGELVNGARLQVNNPIVIAPTAKQ